ncbi:VOC family protein [Streptomyces sp. NBC_00258]|uniref:VOC family protein n=1 Tax=Streptomyces sp. NBC_00258 TaxID=2903642 RepID=UPI002E29CACB|nr:VOC family protein [Streptomyces sp. NBC_00258]
MRFLKFAQVLALGVGEERRFEEAFVGAGELVTEHDLDGGQSGFACGSHPLSHADAFAATAVQTFTHLALQVPDLDGAFARLTQDGGAAAVSRPAPGASEGMRYAYVADPEGNLLELIETS